MFEQVRQNLPANVVVRFRDIRLCLVSCVQRNYHESSRTFKKQMHHVTDKSLKVMYTNPRKVVAKAGMKRACLPKILSAKAPYKATSPSFFSKALSQLKTKICQPIAALRFPSISSIQLGKYRVLEVELHILTQHLQSTAPKTVPKTKKIHIGRSTRSFRKSTPRSASCKARGSDAMID